MLSIHQSFISCLCGVYLSKLFYTRWKIMKVRISVAHHCSPAKAALTRHERAFSMKNTCLCLINYVSVHADSFSPDTCRRLSKSLGEKKNQKTIKGLVSHFTAPP